MVLNSRRTSGPLSRDEFNPIRTFAFARSLTRTRLRLENAWDGFFSSLTGKRESPAYITRKTIH